MTVTLLTFEDVRAARLAPAIDTPARVPDAAEPPEVPTNIDCSSRIDVAFFEGAAGSWHRPAASVAPPAATAAIRADFVLLAKALTALRKTRGSGLRAQLIAPYDRMVRGAVRYSRRALSSPGPGEEPAFSEVFDAAAIVTSHMAATSWPAPSPRPLDAEQPAADDSAKRDS